MFKTLASWLLILSLVSVSATENGYPRCNCDDEGSWWSIESILECQRVSDFLIAVAYFSIPIELLYFVSCSNVPFKWVLVEFIAFIVLCGLTHLLNGWTYGPHPFQLMLSLTVFKILTALVSCATAITLITLIPLLLKVKVREFMLKKKTWDLGREVGMMMKQKEAGMHVRMLTQEIRKSLDSHTILCTTLFELSETLGLQYCAVWMPNENKTEMILTHELKGRNYSNVSDFTIPISDPDVAKIKANDGVSILQEDSTLVSPSRELGGQPRSWSSHELEIIKVVADQVAVALSHAGLLEESQLMREKLAEQNRALQQARMSAMLASQARNSFQKVMSNGMRRPMHSILGLLSMLQDENLNNEQRVIVDTMARTSNVLSTLINDVMDNSAKDSGRFPLEMRSFSLHSMIREAACLAKCLCVYNGFSFAAEVDRSLPDRVVGDEKRVFQVILHMVGNLLNKNTGRGLVILCVFPDTGSQGGNDPRWAAWRQGSLDGDAYIRFEIRMNDTGSQSEGTSLALQHGRIFNRDGVEGALSFSICKKVVQLMQGNIRVVPNPLGSAQSMALVLRFQLKSSISIAISESSESSSEHPNSNSLFKGLRVLLVDHDDVNRAVTRKLLQKLGCNVTSLSSGHECLTAITPPGSTVQVILLDLHIPDLDGFEVAMRIRKFRRSWPLIIALTASTDGGVWERCMQIGINGLIRKPVLLQGFANELRTVLQANKIVR